jgi:NAD(P)-dependent dehydrogenase (short-subunit alcohol dehydrogenase family)
MARLPDELVFLANRSAKQSKTDARMDGKICVLTGATSGVGLAAARALAAGGAELAMVGRNPEKLENTRRSLLADYGCRAVSFVADLADLSTVRQAAGEILARFPRLDVLVNSAGMHSTRLLRTKEGHELVFCVNHLAPFLLTCLLLDRMKSSAPSRIIQINSEGHRFGGLDPNDLAWRKRHYTGLRGYGASKIAQLLTTWEFADRLAKTGVTINAMHPGDVRTNIGNNNGPLYRWFQHHVVWHALKDVRISGEAIYWLAAAPDPASISGRFFHLTNEEKPTPRALDRTLGKVIWAESLRLCGLPAEL